MPVAKKPATLPLVETTAQDYPSVTDRIAAGKALRQRVKRSELGVYEPPQNRPDLVGVLKAQAKDRVPDLVPIRHGRMLASPFAYLRGSAAVMMADTASAPTTGIQVQTCGDMHVSNFGVFASAERNLVFAINDFDDTYPGPWEWDLKRLATSAVVAGRHLGCDGPLCEAAVQATVISYAEHLRTYADMGYLDLWYDTITDEELLQKLPDSAEKYTQRMLDKARDRNHLQVLDQMTDLVDDRHHIVEDPPLVVRAETLKESAMAASLELLLQDYFESLGGDRRFLLSRYRVIDVARRVVGVGSVGTRCWVIYLEGKDASDPLFLQVKEAQGSVLAPYSKELCDYRLPDNHEGRRVVIGQKLIQGSPDIFLGWGELDGIQYYIRQLRDMKGGFKLEPGKFQAANLPDYCALCGWALALAHAKSGDAAMLSGYVGKGNVLAKAMTTFAEAYADQNERDYEYLVKAADQGLIPVAYED
ncbi:DUF2252 domain-containing protein [Leptolyngbya sp. CCNP1308]|uniref:DUF2252 domain-containing protein n=1 Tax=Leptolyngbya sp. CCNP1308 TaxID=3110255 RepID=UPI002B20CA0E|nr:DUF2252 domain-containing protein [Leptolyngbya sp. CCNP1308]MEA5452650.1 DUF2252 domain-containing protein [Leptolyngbya sp. CCNP1308]